MAYVESLRDYTLKTLRTNKGIKYIVCDDFLRKQKVTNQMTQRYTPQQNGVGQRKDITIMDNVRSMLHCKNLPRIFVGYSEETKAYKKCTIQKLKRQSSTRMCIFVGYSEATKAYKLSNLKTQKVVIGRNVTFDEDRSEVWSKKEKQLLYVLVTINEEVNDKVDEPSTEPTQYSPPRKYPKRDRCPPPHLKDYNVGRDDNPDDREEEVTYYALFC